MNVNAQYKLGIDRNTLQQVSQEILKRAAEKNSQYNNNTSSAVRTSLRPVDTGIDLYKGNIDTNLAKQIALNNSGLQIQLNQNVLQAVSYLNSQAAQSQNIQKNIEGKMTIALSEGVGNTQKNEEFKKFDDGIVSLAAGKDKNGSAPSYNGEFLFIKKSKDESEKKDI